MGDLMRDKQPVFDQVREAMKEKVAARDSKLIATAKIIKDAEIVVVKAIKDARAKITGIDAPVQLKANPPVQV